jgi:transposase-like protein
MKTSEFIEEKDLFEKAIQILMDNLGPVETSRFLAISEMKRMESVKRHRLWQSGLDKDAFFNTVFKK